MCQYPHHMYISDLVDVEGTESPNKSKEFLGSIPAFGLFPG